MTRTYRGASLEELLPQIRAELGDGAVITRQREGIVGGVGGFFGRKTVEIEARTAEQTPTFDVLEEPAEEEENALLTELYRQAKPFAEHLDEAIVDEQPAELEPVSTSTQRENVRAAFALAGIPRDVAETVFAEIDTHLRPFDQMEPLAGQARRALARRVKVKHGWRTQRRTIALVGAAGSGRTLTAAKLCHAYASGTDLSVAALSLEPAREALRLGTLTELVDVGLEIADDPQVVALARRRLAKTRLVVADTPAVEAGDARSLERVGALLEALRPDETHFVVDAATAPDAARLLLLDLQVRTKVDRILVTHADDPGAGGAVVGVSLASRLPVSYVADGRLPVSGLRPAEPDELASLVLR